MNAPAVTKIDVQCWLCRIRQIMPAKHFRLSGPSIRQQLEPGQIIGGRIAYPRILFRCPYCDAGSAREIDTTAMYDQLAAMGVKLAEPGYNPGRFMIIRMPPSEEFITLYRFFAQLDINEVGRIFAAG